MADQLDLKLSSTLYADPNTTNLVLSASGTYDTRGGWTGFSGRIDDNTTKVLDEEAGIDNKNTLNNSNFTLYRDFWRTCGKTQSYRVLNAVYSSNDALGVDHRFSLGVGVGRYFIQDLGHELAVSAGIRGVKERRFAGDKLDLEEGGESQVKTIDCIDTEQDDPNNTAAEMFINLQWQLYRFASRDMDISLVGKAYPSLSDWGNTRGDLNLVLSWELFPSFYWTIDAHTDFDSAADDTRDPRVDTTDYTISTGIAWSY